MLRGLRVPAASSFPSLDIPVMPHSSSGHTLGLVERGEHRPCTSLYRLLYQPEICVKNERSAVHMTYPDKISMAGFDM